MDKIWRMVIQGVLIPEAVRRDPKPVMVLDSKPARLVVPAPPKPVTPRQALARPVDEPLRQLGISDPRPVWAMQRERDFLLDWSRTVAARLRIEQAEEDRRLGIDPLLRRVGGDAGFVEWQREIERRVRWLDDQIRRKNAAIRNGLIAA